MSSKDVYKELLQIYASGYRNPEVVLEHHIDELVNQGKTREEAIAAIYEKEKRPEDTQESLAKRVKQLESELEELKTSGSEVGSDAVSESREGLSFSFFANMTT
jgi:ABC-type enterochelin transport system substrate-binding protein